MKREEFERSRLLWHYDEFMSDSLTRNGLEPADYASFMPTVLEIVIARREKDPLAMYERVVDEMSKRWTASERLPTHGGWHHAVVPAILMAALRNCGHPFGDEQVREAFKRGSMIPSGGCGFHGVCGAGTGVGVVISIITRSTPLHDGERSAAMDTTTEAFRRISALGGPRCCPLSAYASLDYGANVLRDRGYRLEPSDPVGRCAFFAANDECHGADCPYHPSNDSSNVTVPSAPSSEASTRRGGGSLR